MSELANIHDRNIQPYLKDMHDRVVKHRLDMERVHREAIAESAALSGEPLVGEVLEPVGAEFHSIETGPDTSAPALPGLELAQFERTVISVLAGYVDDLHNDNGHAKSEQYQHVMQRRLQRAVELLDGVAE